MGKRVWRNRIDTPLIVEIAGKEKLDVFRSTLDTDIVFMSRTPVIIKVIVPVEISVVFVLSVLFHDPGTGRIFHLVVAAYPELLVVFRRVGGVVETLISAVE